MLTIGDGIILLVRQSNAVVTVEYRLIVSNQQVVFPTMETLVSLVLLILPTLVILWAWRTRNRQAVTWRERLSSLTLSILTVNLAYCAVFLLWPYFGAVLGSGAARWELTAKLVAFGFWVSAFTLTLATV